jgi:hypothetical protein
MDHRPAQANAALQTDAAIESQVLGHCPRVTLQRNVMETDRHQSLGLQRLRLRVARVATDRLSLSRRHIGLPDDRLPMLRRQQFIEFVILVWKLIVERFVIVVE